MTTQSLHDSHAATRVDPLATRGRKLSALGIMREGEVATTHGHARAAKELAIVDRCPARRRVNDPAGG